MAEKLVNMRNSTTGEELEVHPTAVGEHEALGWQKWAQTKDAPVKMARQDPNTPETPETVDVDPSQVAQYKKDGWQVASDFYEEQAKAKQKAEEKAAADAKNKK